MYSFIDEGESQEGEKEAERLKLMFTIRVSLRIKVCYGS